MIKQFALPVVATLLAIAAGTYVQGRLVDRWGQNSSEELARFEERLTHVPDVIGDWEGIVVKDDPEQLQMAGITGNFSRVYQNRRTGEVVSVFLVCGKAVNIADHTPDLCYVASGFTMVATPNNYRIDVQPQPAHFYYTVFYKELPDRTLRQLIFWTWHAPEGQWQAPTWPALKFSVTPALYKMYLIADMGDESPALEESSIIRFARDALPVLEEALFPSSPGSEVAERRPPDEGGDS